MPSGEILTWPEASLFAFPPERIEPDARSRCQTLPEGDLPTDITIRAMTLRDAAATGDVEVVVSNDSATTVHLVPSRIAEFTTPGPTRLVSAFTEAMSAEERESLRLEPGAEITITAASIASCNVDVGYSLPAGAYEFVLPIYVFDSPAWESDVSGRVLLRASGGRAPMRLVVCRR